jgi:arabinose-5-phosphate isomerase
MVDSDSTILDKTTDGANAALQSARRVLETEIGGLRALSDALDGAFAQAVDLIAAVSGRIIVTGMGKSGHQNSRHPRLYRDAGAIRSPG